MRNAKVIAELKRVAAENGGRLMPQDVVREARPKSSPLHAKFEWRDSVAGPAYRLWQARQLIEITVEYVGVGKDASLQRVFVSLKTDRRGDGGYLAISSVLSEPELKRQLLADAREDMERFQRKYADLRELAAVFSAMRKVFSKNRIEKAA